MLFISRKKINRFTVAENKTGGNLVHVLRALETPQIFIEILENTKSIINILVHLEKEILEIKKRIQEELLKDVGKYKLFFHDDELDNLKKLSDYGIKNETVLQLCEDKIIFVKGLENKFKIQVNRTE